LIAGRVGLLKYFKLNGRTSGCSCFCDVRSGSKAVRGVVSGLPGTRTTDITRPDRLVRSVPTTVVACKEKAARRRLDIRDLDFSQVASAALFRRYTMKPRPAKPSSSIAQVESSGTAATVSKEDSKVSVPAPKGVKIMLPLERKKVSRPDMTLPPANVVGNKPFEVFV
jgi:hypothetical protein